jgi:uncharacterized protein
MAHPHKDLVRAEYDAFSRGDLDALRQAWSPNIVWDVAGRSPVAGDYKGVDAVLGFFGKLIEARPPRLGRPVPGAP